MKYLYVWEKIITTSVVIWKAQRQVNKGKSFGKETTREKKQETSSSYVRATWLEWQVGATVTPSAICSRLYCSSCDSEILIMDV